MKPCSGQTVAKAGSAEIDGGTRQPASVMGAGRDGHLSARSQVLTMIRSLVVIVPPAYDCAMVPATMIPCPPSPVLGCDPTPGRSPTPQPSVLMLSRHRVAPGQVSAIARAVSGWHPDQDQTYLEGSFMHLARLHQA